MCMCDMAGSPTGLAPINSAQCGSSPCRVGVGSDACGLHVRKRSAIPEWDLSFKGMNPPVRYLRLLPMRGERVMCMAAHDDHCL